MSQFILTWVITALSLLITAYLIPGITINGFTVAAIATLVMGLINAIVKPILLLFTLPLTILTLGLFLFVVNAISFSLVSYFTPGFTVNSFLDALFGSIVLSIVSSFLGKIFEAES
ncbi:phage holin family protein [Crocosphaera watsonii WH 8501]|uniref:phage holin family protein n=1 Tax=Crocosphaera TaxID=263510 RepID=UPI0005653228|nr:MULTISPECIES: phage holin family protein [Crocosphaera]MCH2246824.1 phage holin family protein [Crocosphaera sp.]